MEARLPHESAYGIPGSCCSLLGGKELRMDRGARFTEDTVDDRGFSSGGFSIDEPSNKPLKLSIGRGRPLAA